MQEVKVLETAPAIVVALSGEIAAENADEFYAEIKGSMKPIPRTSRSSVPH